MGGEQVADGGSVVLLYPRRHWVEPPSKMNQQYTVVTSAT